MRASVVLPLPDSPMMVKISGRSAVEREADVRPPRRTASRAEQPAHRVGPADVLDGEQVGSSCRQRRLVGAG